MLMWIVVTNEGSHVCVLLPVCMGRIYIWEGRKEGCMSSNSCSYFFLFLSLYELSLLLRFPNSALPTRILLTYHQYSPRLTYQPLPDLPERGHVSIMEMLVPPASSYSHQYSPRLSLLSINYINLASPHLTTTAS